MSKIYNLINYIDYYIHIIVFISQLNLKPYRACL